MMIEHNENARTAISSCVTASFRLVRMKIDITVQSICVMAIILVKALDLLLSLISSYCR
jgi:hypothetical protein